MFLNKNILISKATFYFSKVEIFLASLLFVLLIFRLGYHYIDPKTYKYRDDGLITFSHVKNLFEYGHIGVSPSGERVEGYSTPLDFILYTGWYAILGDTYTKYIDFKTLFCTFLIGLALLVPLKKYWTGSLFVFAIVGGILIVNSVRFLQWHGAGFDNPLSNAFLYLFLSVSYLSVMNRKIYWYFSILAFLASITRVEHIFYVFPILFLWVIFLLKDRSVLGKNLLFQLSIFFILYGILFVWRFWYFGQMLPNTGGAQSISLGNNIFATLSGDKSYGDSSFELSSRMFDYNLGFVFYIGLALFAFIKLSKNIIFFFVSVLVLFLLTMLHPYIFHATRLDPSRYGSHLAVLSVGTLLFALSAVNYEKKIYSFIAPAFAFVFLVIGIREKYNTKNDLFTAYNLCCDKEAFRGFLDHANYLRRTNGWHRPMVANPDLGLVSNEKIFNNLDIAFIGSKSLTSLYPSEPIINEYVTQVAKPQVFEAHEYWSCMHRTLFNSSVFTNTFEPINQSDFDYCWPSKQGVYVAKDVKLGSGTPERLFYNKIRQVLIDIDFNKDAFIALLNKEIAIVNNAKSANIYNGTYIIRVLYEFMPEIREYKCQEIVFNAVKELNIGDFGINWLNSAKNANWGNIHRNYVLSMFAINRFGDGVFINNLEQNFEKYLSKKYFVGNKGGWDLYHCNRMFLLIGDKNNKEISVNRFFYHINPKNIESLPDFIKSNGYHNLDFNANEKQILVENKKIIVLEFPYYEVGSFALGQFNGDKQIWKYEK